ncbi:MAG: hypothetical protein RL386_1644 [Bacteroidota bacterium]
MAMGIGNLTDARFFASWEVDWLGFNFDTGSAQYIPPAKAAAIREWVAGPSIAGLFGLSTPEEVALASGIIDLDAAMVSMFADPQIIRRLPKQTPLIVEVVADTETDLTEVRAAMNQWSPFASFFVLDFLKNGIYWDDIGQEHPLGALALRQLCADYPVLLSMDFSPASLRQIADKVRPEGFCLQGGDEEKPGFKSFDAVEGLLETLEII